MEMKTLIVGLDGLEYDNVVKWRLEGLLQKVFGKHDVSMIEKLYTPLVWSAFLTGKNPREFGYTMEYIRQQRLQYRDKGYSPQLRRIFLLRKRVLPKRSLGLRKLAIKLGLFKIVDINLREDVKKETFISKLEDEGYGVYSEEFPSFNEEYENELYFRSYLKDLINKEFSYRLKEVEKRWKIVLNRWKRAINAIPDHDLVVFYSPFPDFAHHVLFRTQEIVYVKKYYIQLENLPFLKELKNIATLIVSDHGFIHEKHTHSNHGFWSLNIDLPLKPKTILDFYKIVLRLVRT